MPLFQKLLMVLKEQQGDTESPNAAELKTLFINSTQAQSSITVNPFNEFISLWLQSLTMRTHYLRQLLQLGPFFSYSNEAQHSKVHLHSLLPITVLLLFFHRKSAEVCREICMQILVKFGNGFAAVNFPVYILRRRKKNLQQNREKYGYLQILLWILIRARVRAR